MSPEMTKIDHKPLGIKELLNLLNEASLDQSQISVFLAELARSAATLNQKDAEILEREVKKTFGEKDKVG